MPEVPSPSEQTLAHLQLVAIGPGYYEIRALARRDDGQAMAPFGSYWINTSQDLAQLPSGSIPVTAASTSVAVSEQSLCTGLAISAAPNGLAASVTAKSVYLANCQEVLLAVPSLAWPGQARRWVIAEAASTNGLAF